MSTIWTGVFVREGFHDTPEDRAEAVSGFAGAAVCRALTPALVGTGWPLGEPFAEDYGWRADCAVDDQGKQVVLALNVAPDEDGPAFAAGPPEPDQPIDHWRIMIDMDLGLFAGTKARRTAVFRRFAADIESAALALGGRDFEWQEGGPR
jgi:hypothetical protein